MGFSLKRDTLKDVESGIDLRIISVQETLTDKRKYVSPFVAFLKEKGLEEDGFDSRVETYKGTFFPIRFKSSLNLS